ncbi:translation initiation factor IF-2-like [Bubalus kerabau]|uniref:translation initiation factor IF-2-like n=1 Tax=Bubalus carabanensis TaxID=3119969 RepID=UPI00244EA924|nr:translation initiation factor IF-2-like [Bubalus carabanensis]
MECLITIIANITLERDEWDGYESYLNLKAKTQEDEENRGLEKSSSLLKITPVVSSTMFSRAFNIAPLTVCTQKHFPKSFITGRAAGLVRVAATNIKPGLCGRRVATPPPAAATSTPPPPPRHRPRGALTPRRPPPGSGEEAGPGGGVVASPPGSARADARLVYRPQAPGLATAAQAHAALPPARRRPERRAYPEQPRTGKSLVRRGGGSDGGRGGGGRGVTAAAAGQIIRALEREAESGSGRRKSRRVIAFAPHLPGAPHPPSPTTGSRAAAAEAPEAASRAGAETTAPSLPRALPPLAPPPPPRARPRAGALSTAPC